MACHNLALHPLVISTFHQFLFIFIAGFTSARSTIRPLGFIIYLLTTAVALSSFTDYVEPPGWVARTVASAFPQITLTYFERIIVRRITFEDHGGKLASDEKPNGVANGAANGFANGTANGAAKSESTAKANPGKLAQFRSRYAFGQLVASSMRGLGTSWQIKHIHHFDPNDPSYVPARWGFVARNLLQFVTCYFIHRFCTDVQLSLDRDLMTPENVSFFTRLGELSLEEVKVRYAATVTTVFSIYCFIQGGYSLGAAGAALVNSEAIKDWRPIFGKLSSCYCMRRFWA